MKSTEYLGIFLETESIIVAVTERIYDLKELLSWRKTQTTDWVL
jgi:hypothetical protein